MHLKHHFMKYWGLRRNYYSVRHKNICILTSWNLKQKDWEIHRVIQPTSSLSFWSSYGNIPERTPQYYMHMKHIERYFLLNIREQKRPDLGTIYWKFPISLWLWVRTQMSLKSLYLTTFTLLHLQLSTWGRISVSFSILGILLKFSPPLISMSHVTLLIYSLTHFSQALLLHLLSPPIYMLYIPCVIGSYCCYKFYQKFNVLK